MVSASSAYNILAPGSKIHLTSLTHFILCMRDPDRTLSDMSSNLREVSLPKTRHVHILTFPQHLTSSIQKHVWMDMAKLDSNIVDIMLDELVRRASDGGIGLRHCEIITHIVATISSISVRSRVYNTLRKVRLLRYTPWIPS